MSRQNDGAGPSDVAQIGTSGATGTGGYRALVRGASRGAGADNTPERPALSVEQVYAIAGAIVPRHRALVLLAAFTGLRLGELRALRRKRMDLDAATVTVAPEDGNVQRDRSGAVHFTRPKSRAGARSVALPAPVVDEMRAHLELVGDHGPDALVLPADKSADGTRPFHAEAFGRQWRKALASVNGLPPGLVFHDLRHTGNTLAAGTGASTRELATWAVAKGLMLSGTEEDLNKLALDAAALSPDRSALHRCWAAIERTFAVEYDPVPESLVEHYEALRKRR
jgi:integrase